jgi:hypothetical protein
VSREDGRWEEAWVFLARDAAGKEWLVQDADMGRPLVCADRLAVSMWMPRARALAALAAADGSKTIHLVRFTVRQDVEEIKP